MVFTKERLNDSDELSETVHNFLEEGKWFSLLAGYSDFTEPGLKRVLYSLYKGYMFSFLLYITGMACTGAYLSSGSTVDLLQALHMSCLSQVSLLGLVSKWVSGEELRAAMADFQRGVFLYGGEGEEGVKTERTAQIRWLTKLFARFMVFISFTNTVCVPLFKLALISEDTSARTLNPYLPQPFFMPFPTRNIIGYSAAFIINVLYIIKLTPLVICMDSIYLSCTLQLKAQFEILNNSLRNIETRAMRMMNECEEAFSSNNEKILGNKKFHECLYMCLRDNVIHHQRLIRLKWKIEQYTGLIFFIVVCYASCVLASNILSILENPPPYQLANFVITALCEILYTFHYCWYGEQLTEESSKVYTSLYDIPWYKYDRRFAKLLSIALCNSRVPAEMRTTAFGISASLHTFNSIMTNMYQIMNVVRSKR